MTPNLLIQGGTLLHPLTGDAHRADMRIRDGVITESGLTWSVPGNRYWK